MFYSLLNILAEITNRSDFNDVTVMLRAAYVQEVPSPGVPVTVVAQQEVRKILGVKLKIILTYVHVCLSLIVKKNITLD